MSSGGTVRLDLPVSSSTILSELDALCAHPEFARARRQTAFLRYVVGAVLEGNGADLKEYTIAVGALAKGPDFDPTVDSSVRSEASRIRTKLEAIYASEPEAHAIRIVLPKGSYRPAFERVTPAAPPNPNAEDAAAPIPARTAAATSGATSPWFRYGYVILAVLVLLGAGATWLGSRSVPAPPAVQVNRFDAFNGDRAFPTISPDGTLVVFSEVEGGQPFLFVSRRGGSPIPLGQQGEQATWSPDGRQLAFRSSRGGGGLFLLDLTTQEVRRIATSGFHPSWSPDGSRIVYASERFVRPEERPTTASVLSIVHITTGISRRLILTPPLEDAIQPSWSPDGKWIAFWSVDAGGHRDVFVVAAAGGAPTRITEPDPFDWNPVWSPDGRLYWSSNATGATNLWRARIGADGARVGPPEQVPLPATYASDYSFDRTGRLLYANAQPLSSVYRTTVAADGRTASDPVRVTPETLRVRHPSFSPDGQSFVAFTLDPQEDLVVFARDGTNMRRLTDDAFRDRGPEWSPDGRSIAFVSNRGGDYQLWSIQPDGQSLQPLTRHPNGAFVPLWSADGHRLAWFERGYRVFITSVGPAARAPTPVAPDIPFIHTAWWDQDRALLGQLAPDDDQAGSPLVSYSLDARSLRDFGVRGHGPRWLVEGESLLFLRANSLYAFDVATKKETRLLTFAGDVDRRYVVSAADRTLFLLVAQSRVELWSARVQ